MKKIEVDLAMATEHTITLTYTGTKEALQDNLGMDDNFSLVDSIIWLMDYGEADGRHIAGHNNIEIKHEAKEIK